MYLWLPDSRSRCSCRDSATAWFIRAETISYDDYLAAGSEAAARDQGVLRSEGRDYVVKDGDVILFRFNV